MRQQPVREMRKVPPDRQLLCIVDVEGDQHEDIRDAHTGNVQSHPISPTQSSNRMTGPGANDRGSTQYEQMVVLRPAHDGKESGRGEKRQQTPIVHRSKCGVTSAPFLGEHSACSRHDTGYAERDVYPHDRRKEDGITRGNKDPNVGRVSAHAAPRYLPVA